jgi:S-adenosylmethionine hydrolase
MKNNLIKYLKHSILAITLLIFTHNNLLLAKTNKDFKTSALIIMTDFGLKDGAVSAMKGVAHSVDSNLKIFDLSHEIEPYNIWEGAYRLLQVAKFWDKGSVFVSVVDPGVGTERSSIVAKSKSGHYFVNPNNGLLTLIDDTMGIEEIRIIDEKSNRLPNSYDSYTFHGRDVYVYTASRLASKQITFAQVGPKLDKNKLVKLSYQNAKLDNNVLVGMIPVLDPNYGNVWTNIPKALFEKLTPQIGDNFEVKITSNKKVVYKKVISYQNTFGGVNEGEELLYLNSLLELSVAINMGDFATKYKVFPGIDTLVEITKK